MFETIDPEYSPFTTAKLVRAYERAHRRLATLAASVAPLAKSRPDVHVPHDLLVPARQALRALAPVVVALGAPPLLPLHPPVTYAGLAVKLALASGYADTFRRRHFGYNERIDDIVWHVVEWLEEEAKRRAVLGDLEDAGLLDGPWDDELLDADL
jgi:hypothetical protein